MILYPWIQELPCLALEIFQILERSEVMDIGGESPGAIYLNQSNSNYIPSICTYTQR